MFILHFQIVKVPIPSKPFVSCNQDFKTVQSEIDKPYKIKHLTFKQKKLHRTNLGAKGLKLIITSPKNSKVGEKTHISANRLLIANKLQNCQAKTFWI